MNESDAVTDFNLLNLSDQDDESEFLVSCFLTIGAEPSSCHAGSSPAGRFVPPCQRQRSLTVAHLLSVFKNPKKTNVVN